MEELKMSKNLKNRSFPFGEGGGGRGRITWTVIYITRSSCEDDLNEKPKSFFYLPAKAGRFRRPKHKTNNAIPFV